MPSDNALPAWISFGSGIALLVLTLVLRVAAVQTVEFEVTSDVAGVMQVFHDDDGQFNESDSIKRALRAGEPQRIALKLRGNRAMNLRLDPPTGAAMSACGFGTDDRTPSEVPQVIARQQLEAEVRGRCVVLDAPESAGDPWVALRMSGGLAAQLDRANLSRRAGKGCALLAAVLIVIGLWRLAVAYPQWQVERARRLMLWVQERAPVLLAVQMLAFGIGYLALTPPGAVPDEAAHMAKVVRVASGFVYGGSEAELLPDSRAWYGDGFSRYVEDKRPFTLGEVRELVERPLRCEPASPHLPTSANGYFPHHYLLSATALTIACESDASFGVFLYGARFLNLLLAVLLVVLGIRYAVAGRWAIFAIALMPMTLFELASISADSLAISLGLSWLGVLSGLQGGRLSPRQAEPWLFVLGCALALSKAGAIWMLPAVGFCWHAYQRHDASFVRALVLLVLLPCAISMAWVWYGTGMMHAHADVDRHANVEVLLEEPGRFAAVMAGTFSGDSLFRLYRSMVGVLGWLDVVFSPWMYGLAALALLLAWWSNDSIAIRPWMRVMALAMASGSLVLLSLPLFLYWTPTDSPLILGLQGRYFLLTAAFTLAWCGIRAPPRLRAASMVIIIVIAAVINLGALWSTYLAYFVEGRLG